MKIALTVNGQLRELAIVPHQTLLQLLRDALGLFEVKEACSEGVCGACTVLMDGRPVSSCLVLAPLARGRTILTLRGLQTDDALHPLQEAFVEHGAVQCGFCTSGMLLSAAALLAEDPAPTRERIVHYLRGNLCRCTGYQKILEAIAACADHRGDRA